MVKNIAPKLLLPHLISDTSSKSFLSWKKSSIVSYCNLSETKKKVMADYPAMQ
jgi:hypothetical protein